MTVAAPTRVAVELLRFEPLSARASHLLDAFERTADAVGVDLHVTTAYRGSAPLLMLWGPGAPNRFEPMARQIAAGGHIAAWDLAYWARERKFRVSFDAAHPQRWIMRRLRSETRFATDPVPLEQAWNLDGPVIVAGIGEKATVQYGSVVKTWEAEMIAEARARGRRVLYRPKRNGTVPTGVQSAPMGDIETAIRGASVIITWHSNVAVDAIRLGIPVICKDGAASAVCSSTWPTNGMPTPLPDAWRMRFLYNLAWFQWQLNEAEQAWRFVLEELT